VIHTSFLIGTSFQIHHDENDENLSNLKMTPASEFYLYLYFEQNLFFSISIFLDYSTDYYTYHVMQKIYETTKAKKNIIIDNILLYFLYFLYFLYVENIKRMYQKISFHNLVYDVIIPLGEECYTAGTLSSIGARKVAFPFDYVGGVTLQRLHTLLSSDNPYEIQRKDLSIQYHSPLKKFYLCDDRNDFHYWHDLVGTNKEELTEEKIQLFLEKRNRRLQRFQEMLQNQELRILFFSIPQFHTTIHNNNYNQRIDIVDNLFRLLQTLHSKCDMLALQYTDTTKFDYLSFPTGSLHFIYLPFPEKENQDLQENKTSFIQKLNDTIQSLIVPLP